MTGLGSDCVGIQFIFGKEQAEGHSAGVHRREGQGSGV
jgi:hypothetical protein